MDNDRRAGAPALRRKLDRSTNDGPSLGKLMGLAAVGAAAMGALGVIVAASVPAVDLFGIYAARENAAVAKPESSRRPSQGAPAAPLPPPSSPGAAPAPGPAPKFDPTVPAPVDPNEDENAVRENAERLAGPSAIVEGPASLAPARPSPVKPTPEGTTGARSVERDMALLKDLSPAVDLPAVSEVGDTTLSYLHEAAQIPFDEVALLDELTALDERQRFVLEREGSQPRWKVLLTGTPEGAASETVEGGTAEENRSAGAIRSAALAVNPTTSQPAGRALAEVWCFQSSVMFKWLPEAKDLPAAEQLRNAALRFSIGSRHQVMAFRKPLAQPIYTLNLSERSDEVTAAIAHPPRAESLHLEAIGARQMPVNAFFENEQAIVAIPAAAAEAMEPASKDAPKQKPVATPARVTVLFDDLTGGERPQLWIEPRLSAADEVTIRFAPRIVRGKVVDDLTRKSLDLYRLPRDQQIARTERDWKNAHDAVVALDRRIGETRQGINPTVPVKTLQSRLMQAQREYEQLDRELKRIRAELTWVEAAATTIQSLDKHGQLKYRVFAKSGDLEIDLVRAGLD